MMDTPLSPQEQTFFSVLCRRIGEPVPAEDLLNASDSDGFNGVAKVVVHRLRRKLGVRIVAHRQRRGSGAGCSYRLEVA